jgi:hypothetical protein
VNIGGYETYSRACLLIYYSESRLLDILMLPIPRHRNVSVVVVAVALDRAHHVFYRCYCCTPDSPVGEETFLLPVWP